MQNAESWSESLIALGHGSRFATCYARGLARDPKLQGRIELVIDVSPVGTVWGVSMRSDDVGIPEVSQCLLKRAYTLRFLARRSVFEFALPFQFRSR